MRRLSRPGSGSTSGSTFSAKLPWPVGASHSSHARPSTISASALATASTRVSRTSVGTRVGRTSTSTMFGIIASMNPSTATRSHLRDRLRRFTADLLQTLQRWPWLDTARTLRQRFREDRLGLTASSLTFTTLIALVPLVTVMLALFTAFPMFATFQDALQKY